jgi:3-oxoadipate CoA-transferase, alpha subunit
VIDKLVQSPRAALADLPHGAIVMVSGFGGAGSPDTLLRELETLGATGLTLVINSARRAHDIAPLLFDAGRVQHVIASAARGPGRDLAVYEQQAVAAKLEVTIVPQGSFAERIRAGGAGIPAFYTPTGAGTALAAGKEVRSFDGRECVLEHALTADFALLRAERADRWGNVAFSGSQANFGPAMAAAARITVVEVREICDEPIAPHLIGVAGIYVQRVVQVDHP